MRISALVASVPHANDAPGGGRNLCVVGREQQRDPSLPVQPGQQVEHEASVLGVEVARRFVGDEQGRTMNQRAGHGRALHLAARELLG